MTITLPIHVISVGLWSNETAFRAFVAASEFPAFSAAFDLNFSAVWAEEFGGFCSWGYGFAAARTGNKSER
jgi:hypothetical protein